MRRIPVLIGSAMLSAVALFVLVSSLVAQPSFPLEVRVTTNANLRSGPGVTNARVGGVLAGAVLTAVGCNPTCDWYQLDSGAWIAAFLVEEVTEPLAPVPPETSVAPVTPTTPTPSGVVTLTVASWNVESGAGTANPISNTVRIAAFQGVDLWGLSEVANATDAELYETGAEQGENANFEAIVGSTGGGDRLAILYNTERFELIGEPDELEQININNTIRAPLLIHVRDKLSSQDFVFMVNHLYRGTVVTEERRWRQATLLNTWAASDSAGQAVIAVGDYNFDWEVVGGDDDHDPGYDNMTAGEIWHWVRPETLVRTQCEINHNIPIGQLTEADCGFNSVLDFVFTANTAQSWPARSEIVVTPGDFPDDNKTSDHRPILASFQIPVGEPISTTATPTPTVPPEESTPTPTPITSTGPSQLRLGELHVDGDVPQVESDEYIEIVNNGPPLNVVGWHLKDDDGNVFDFPDQVMAEGSTCRVYTNEVHPEFCGFSFGSSEPIWGNSGDVVILVDPAGSEVEQHCWGGGC